MTETHGIGRRCENESTLGVRVLSWAIFETKAQKLAMRLAQRGCWRPHNQKPNPYILYSRLVHKNSTSNRNIQRLRLTKHWNLNHMIRRFNQFVTNAIPFISNYNRNRLSAS